MSRLQKIEDARANASFQRINLMLAEARHGRALYRHLVAINGERKGVQSGLNQLIKGDVKRNVVRAPGISQPKRSFQVFEYSGK